MIFFMKIALKINKKHISSEKSNFFAQISLVTFFSFHSTIFYWKFECFSVVFLVNLESRKRRRTVSCTSGCPFANFLRTIGELKINKKLSKLGGFHKLCNAKERRGLALFKLIRIFNGIRVFCGTGSFFLHW